MSFPQDVSFFGDVLFLFFFLLYFLVHTHCTAFSLQKAVVITDKTCNLPACAVATQCHTTHRRNQLLNAGMILFLFLHVQL